MRNVLEVHHVAAVGFDAGYQTTAAQPRDDPRFSSWLLIKVTVVQGIPTMGIPTMTKCLERVLCKVPPPTWEVGASIPRNFGS